MSRPVLYVLFFVSGLSALVYEVVWLRLFAGFFGVTLHATSAVLAAYLGGLALGSAIAGRRIERRADSLKIYGWIEIGVGLSAALVPVLLSGARSLYGALSSGGGESSPGLLGARFVIAMVVLAVPTMLLGASLPVITRGLARTPSRAGPTSGQLYAVNTLGAVVGVLVAGLLLVPRLGVMTTNLVAALLSAAVGAFVIARSRGPEAPPPKKKARKPTGPKLAASRWALGVAAASGFAALGYEVVWMRVIAAITHDTVFSVTAVLAVFLFGIGLGSQVAARLDRKNASRWAWLGSAQVGIALYALVGPRLVRYLDGSLAGGIEGSSWWWGAFGLPLGAAALVATVPTFLMGASMPLAFAIAARGTGTVATATGRVYAANTVGAIAGALVTGLVLVPRLGVARSVVAAAAVNVAAAAVSFLRHRASGKKRLPKLADAALYLGIPGALVAAYALATAGSHAFYAPRDDSRRVVFEREDAVGLVEVLEGPPGVRALVTDRVHRWGTSDEAMMRSMVRQGYLPLLLHPKPEHVVEIGLGTGVSFAPVVAYGEVARADMVEISPAVVEAARHFSEEGARLLESGKLDLSIADGRNHLRLTDRAYDVVVLGLFVPYRPGSGDLFSRETYESGRARLRAGGLLVHWLPLDQMTSGGLRSVLATFQSVFPDVHVWEKGQYLALVGPRDRFEVDFGRFAEAMEHPSITADLGRWRLAEPVGFFASFLMGPDGVRAFSAGAPLNTENRPRLEFSRIELSRPGRYDLASKHLVDLVEHRRLASGRIKNITPEELRELERAHEARGHSLAGAVHQARKEHKRAFDRFRRAFELYPKDEIARSELVKYGRALKSLRSRAVDDAEP